MEETVGHEGHHSADLAVVVQEKNVVVEDQENVAAEEYDILSSENDEAVDVDKSLDMIISCVDIIYNEEESWAASDSSKKEMKDFIEQMNTKQFKDIENFFVTMPKLSHTIKVTNRKTKVESDIVLEGLASFFS